MKRLLAALLAALLIWTLAACKEDPAPVDPEDPEITEPQDTEEPTDQAPDGSETPETSEDPEAPGETPETPETQTPDGGSPASVTDQVTEGQVEESISYRITMPKVSTGDAAADQILADYYAAAAGKMEDLCYGDLYTEAMDNQTMYHMDTTYSVEQNDGSVLSIRRTVTITDLKSNDLRSTIYAETFALPGGGLMTADDFFLTDPTDRLVDQVRRIISEDPYHDQYYDAQWSDLCRSAFNKDQFYVTDGFYVVFYQDGDLGPGGTTLFEIPWSALRDIVK